MQLVHSTVPVDWAIYILYTYTKLRVIILYLLKALKMKDVFSKRGHQIGAQMNSEKKKFVFLKVCILKRFQFILKFCKLLGGEKNLNHFFLKQYYEILILSPYFIGEIESVMSMHSLHYQNYNSCFKEKEWFPNCLLLTVFRLIAHLEIPINLAIYP